MTVQQVQPRQADAGVSKQAPQADSEPTRQDPPTLPPATAQVKSARRFTNTTVASTALSEYAPEEQQQQRQSTRSARKRLSLPFRRASQVFASTITDVDIYYGSMTGTAARLAALLAKDITARGVNTTLQSLEHFDERVFIGSDKLASTHASVFVASTHFAGSASPSAELFYEWLKAASSASSSSSGSGNGSDGYASVAQTHARVQHDVVSKALASLDLTNSVSELAIDTTASTIPVTASTPSPPAHAVGSFPLRFLLNWGRDFGRKRPRDQRSNRRRLKGFQYAVFGVGNSVYLTFNAMGKFVDARLHILGGVRLSPLGLGDVSEDVDTAFLKWKTGFLQQLPVIPHNVRLIAFESDLLLMEPQQRAVQQRQLRRVGSFSRMQQHRRKQQHNNDDSSSCHTCITAVHYATTMKSMVVDRYNKPVRLRFRCRAIKEPEAMRRSSASTKSSVIENTPSVAAARTTSTKHCLHTRRPNVRLQSISLLQQDAQSSSSQGPKDIPSPAMTASQQDPRTQVALVRIDLLDPDMKFQAADTFGYLPRNCFETVERIAASLGFDLDTWIELYFETARDTNYQGQLPHTQPQQQHHQLPFSTPCTVRTALTEFLELSTVTREFLRVASGFVSNDSERDVMEQLASTDGSAAFTDQFVKQHKGILQLLELVPSLKIPFEVFVNITPLIKPRLYSIACSHLNHPRQIELAVNFGRRDEQQGVSATFFRNMMALLHSKNSKGVMLHAFISRSPFKVPTDITSPMIMIANGVGIAPMRGLLEHRKLEYDKLQSSSGGSASVPPQNLLFYGCKDSSSILFHEELRKLENESFLTLKLAFSAQGIDGKPPEYVQNIVALHLKEIVELTNSSSDARIFVSGMTAMARNIQQMFQSYTPDGEDKEDGGGMTKSWFDEIAKSGRFIQDAF